MGCRDRCLRKVVYLPARYATDAVASTVAGSKEIEEKDAVGLSTSDADRPLVAGFVNKFHKEFMACRYQEQWGRF